MLGNKGLFGYNSFWKLFFILKNKKNTRNTFGSMFSFVFKNMENTETLNSKNNFSKNRKMMFFVFLKIVLINNFKKTGTKHAHIM